MNTLTNTNEPKGLKRFWREWRGFVVFIVVMLLFRSAIADWNQVPSGSMLPSILIGDRIVVDKLAYDLRVPFTLARINQWADPERSDIVTFESPEDGKLLVKRVVGVPGDEVQMVDNQLYVNGEAATYSPVPPDALPQPIAQYTGAIDVAIEQVQGKSRTVMIHRMRNPTVRRSFGPVKVPPEYYLMLGDNRDNSQDYRKIGLVHRQAILGKANSIAFSLDYDRYYLPRTDRFGHALQ